MRPYISLIHESLRSVAIFINRALLVAGVFLAITGFFLHYYNQDKIVHTDKVKEVRAHIYQTNDALKNNKNPKVQAVLGTFRFATCASLGEACTNNPKDGDINYNSSILGYMGNMIALPYQNPPSSGIAWVQDSMQNVGLVPHTYAAGIGFYSLSAFQKIWQIFRNITFFLMALAIVAVGFLIMFRVKLDSQTVISIENSLPRIIITLLLITFSYAIAGFMVDLMYVVIMIAINIFGNVGSTGIQSVTVDNLKSVYLTNQVSIFSAFLGTTTYMEAYVEGLRGLIEIIPEWIKLFLYVGIYSYLYAALLGFLTRTFGENIDIGADVSIVVAGLNLKFSRLVFFIIFGVILGIILPIFIYFVIPFLLALIVLLFLFFRIFFMLLRCYVQIAINIIFAPVLILPNVLPGNNAFMDWFKRILGNLAAFPITIILLITVQLIAINDEFIGFRSAAGYLPGQSTHDFSAVQFSMPMLPFKTSQLVPIIAAVFLLVIPELVMKVVNSIAGASLIEAGPGALIGGVGGAVGTVFRQYSGLAALNQTLKGTNPIGRVLNSTGLFGKADTNARESAPPPAATETIIENS